jgi:MmpS family membrane protein
MLPFPLRSLGLLVLLALAGSGCVKNYPPLPSDSTDPTTAPTPVPVSHTVEFRVLGTVPLTDITYGNSQDGTTMTETTVPWAASFKTTRTTLFVYLKAQSAFSGTITAQIFVDGTLFREASNNFLGSTNVADASGTVTLAN